MQFLPGPHLPAHGWKASDSDYPDILEWALLEAVFRACRLQEACFLINLLINPQSVICSQALRPPFLRQIGPREEPVFFLLVISTQIFHLNLLL